MPGIYIISHPKHVYTWRSYIAEGFPIISSWLNDPDVSNPNRFKPNWLERERDLEFCSCIFIYSCCKDLSPISMLEIGMAAGFSKNMYALGDFQGKGQLSYHPQFLFREFPQWDVRKTLTEAQTWDRTGLADRIRESKNGKTSHTT